MIEVETVELGAAPGSRARATVALPDDWNGRLVGVGSGGYAGSLNEAEVRRYAARGFAAVTTDLGTAPDPKIAGWDNAEVVADFGHRATHLATVVARERVLRKFGRPPRASYFVGISTGGQQAFSLAQRHPEDYDGIIAGVPAHSRTALHAYFLWNWQHTRRKDGTPLFTKEQEAAYRAATLAHFAGRERFPRARGRFISDPRWDVADRMAVVERARRLDPSLTDAHAEALRALQDGPVHASTGKRLFDGIPPNAAFEPACSNLYLFNWAFGPDIDYWEIDFAGDIDRYFAMFSAELDADGIDLDAFRARGGKMVVYSGTQDGSVPYHATLDWYRRVTDRIGSVEETQTFCRYYLLPGRNHIGGPGVQELVRPLEALRLWCEKGKAPSFEGVSCTENYKIPVAPYPQCFA